jgi:hypothetical protein
MMQKYKRALFLKSAECLSPIVRVFEKDKIRRYASMGHNHWPIFIIGAPRTGSTLLYQLLTNAFDVLYIDNLTHYFYKNIFFGFWLSNRLFHQRIHHSFTSKEGRTSGLHSPSECGDFWYRWLPRDKHYIARAEMSSLAVQEMQQNIYSLMNRYDRSILFKNLNAGLRLGMLSEVTPNARFIWIKRDPRFVAQSILKTRVTVSGSREKWWSLMPKDHAELRNLSYHRQIVMQIYSVEKQIMQDLSLFSDKSCMVIDYADLCQNSEKTIKTVQEHIGCEINVRNRPVTSNIRYNEKDTFEKDIVEKLNTEIKRLDWKAYSN